MDNRGGGSGGGSVGGGPLLRPISTRNSAAASVTASTTSKTTLTTKRTTKSASFPKSDLDDRDTTTEESDADPETDHSLSTNMSKNSNNKKHSGGGREEPVTTSSSSDDDLIDLEPPEKGQRRTDHRYESSESSDSGVATLSPSTSDSPELISPYSPLGDFSTSDQSANISGLPSLSPCNPFTRDKEEEEEEEEELLGINLEDRNESPPPPTLLPEFIPFPAVSLDPPPPPSPPPGSGGNERKRSKSPTIGGKGVVEKKRRTSGTPYPLHHTNHHPHLLTNIWEALKKNVTKEQLTDLSNKPEFQPFVQVEPLRDSVFIAPSKRKPLKQTHEVKDSGGSSSTSSSSGGEVSNKVKTEEYRGREEEEEDDEEEELGGPREDILSDLSMIFSQNSEFIAFPPTSPANLLDTLDDVTGAFSEPPPQRHHSSKKLPLNLQKLPTTPRPSSESDTLSTYSNKSDSTTSTTSVLLEGLVLGVNSTNCTLITSRDRLLSTLPAPKSTPTWLCMWKNCELTRQVSCNILEHIQNVHVAPQKKSEGFVCLWEGCKVWGKKSSSLSWLERHILCHSGNKPFPCIMPGCGLAFGSQATLEKHINSHITTTEMANGSGHSSLLHKRMDPGCPHKGLRRKKKPIRKPKQNVGQHSDFFDKRMMEYIKHRLVSNSPVEEVIGHGVRFYGEVLNELTIEGRSTQFHVRWHPEHIMPEELVDLEAYSGSKVVPFQRIPKDKLHLIFPHMIPGERGVKAPRKWKRPQGGRGGGGGGVNHHIKLEEVFHNQKEEVRGNNQVGAEEDSGCDCGSLPSSSSSPSPVHS